MQMAHYSWSQEQENTSKDMDLCHIREIYPENMGKN